MTSKEQHIEEAKALALVLYQIDQRRDAVLRRLRELDMIVGTLEVQEKKEGE